MGPMTREVDVLLVEDNQVDMTLTLRALSRQVSSDRVRVARDGEEALDFVICRGACSNETSVPRLNLILLDLKLPKFSGMDVLAELKTHARTKVIPVVIFSSSKQSSKEGSMACCSAEFLDLSCQFLPLYAPLMYLQLTIAVAPIALKPGALNDFNGCP